jgi:type IV secretion system protein VirB3
MQEPIFPGASRPPMKWGVPLMAIVAVFMPAAVLSIWLGVIVSWMAALGVVVSAVVAFIWMRRVTRHDDHRLSQAWMAIRLARRNRNRVLRSSVRSYSPVALRGADDGWRR